jgi:hypothetical protein
MAVASGAHALLSIIAPAWNTSRIDRVVDRLKRGVVGIDRDQLWKTLRRRRVDKGMERGWRKMCLKVRGAAGDGTDEQYLRATPIDRDRCWRDEALMIRWPAEKGRSPRGKSGLSPSCTQRQFPPAPHASPAPGSVRRARRSLHDTCADLTLPLLPHAVRALQFNVVYPPQAMLAILARCG